MLDKKIQFKSPIQDLIPHPKPAKFYIPEAYKKMSKRFDTNLQVPGTVKACMPFLDAYTTGYIIPFPVDHIYQMHEDEHKTIEISVNNEIPNEFLSNTYDVGVSQHSHAQVHEDLRHSKRTVDATFKFQNPWTIITPTGYSCLFVTPFNRNYPFELVTGIVDTDTYNLSVHLPFYWVNKDISETVIMKQGSPMVLVIPFKRESWKMEVATDDKQRIDKGLFRLRSSFVDMYKNLFWNKKSFK